MSNGWTPIHSNIPISSICNLRACKDWWRSNSSSTKGTRSCPCLQPLCHVSKYGICTTRYQSVETTTWYNMSPQNVDDQLWSSCTWTDTPSFVKALLKLLLLIKARVTSSALLIIARGCDVGCPDACDWLLQLSVEAGTVGGWPVEECRKCVRQGGCSGFGAARGIQCIHVALRKRICCASAWRGENSINSLTITEVRWEWTSNMEQGFKMRQLIKMQSDTLLN